MQQKALVSPDTLLMPPASRATNPQNRKYYKEIPTDPPSASPQDENRRF